MGGCFSNPDNDEKISASAANVITLNGEFRRFTLPITVSQVVVQLQTPSSSSFFCNSDNLYYDEFIPALDSDHELQSGQIYFILPITKLNYPLSASDMAALAVKASTALSAGNNGSRRSNYNKKARISPVLAMEVKNERVSVNKTSSYSDGVVKINKKGYSDKMADTRISRSVSMRKLQRYYSSRRAKLAARSFRLGLKTIYEGYVLRF